MSLTQQERTRNFSIIAHIDHGKSTLADRLIEKTGLISAHDMEDQLLDNMELERERGITIKLQAIRLLYKAKDGNEYILNLIDTPGHVDFTYEVSRSLAACEGAVLVVDASQGIEAQTIANVYLALDNDLEILPVINKIDLASAEPDRVKGEIEDIVGLPAEDAPLISAKADINIDEVLEDIVHNVPAPTGDVDAPLKALIFDSYYDQYRGVIASVRIVEGTIKAGMRCHLMAGNLQFDVEEVGFFENQLYPGDRLQAGDVGYVVAGVKTVGDIGVGDTITEVTRPAADPLPGYKKVIPMVYCGIYPADGAKYEDLKEALARLQLNDASLLYEAETSIALGFGFRCGFLGLLHMDVIQERLEREFNLDLVTTAPSVIYKVLKTDGELLWVDNPANLPDPSEIEHMEEPIVNATIMVPSDYLGTVMELCQERRGIYINIEYLEETRVSVHYELPLNEIVYDFFDALKSRTRGYASLDYEVKEYREADLVKMDILLNGDIVDALSFIFPKEKAIARGRVICKKLKETIPRQMFEIPIQAAIGNKIVARQTLSALRKDVLAKCYGGDITRKRKLLEKQKAGKKRMRQVGSVEVPQEAFMAVLKLDS